MELEHRLRRGRLIAAPAVALAVAAADPRPLLAQEGADPTTVEELEGIIRQRDAVIDDLLRRVDELEQRLAKLEKPAARGSSTKAATVSSAAKRKPATPKKPPA